MVLGLLIALPTPLRPEPTMSATSGLKPFSLVSRNSFDSLTLAIIALIHSLCDKFRSGHNRVWADVIRLLHHAFGFGGAAGIVVVHYHQRLTVFNAVADLLRPLESDAEINRIARDLATASERDDCVSNLVALDRVYLTGSGRDNLLLMLGRRQRSELA